MAHAVRTLKKALSRLLLERRYGLETSSVVALSDLDLADDTRNNYIPSGWGTMRRISQMRTITSRDVFVDFGSGKGRMVFLAARHPFRRVVGVELSTELHNVASRNIARNRARLRCRDIQLVNGDVLQFRIPDDMTFAYFFNPFTGDVFRSVTERIHESLRRNPRRISLFYTRPVMHEYLASQSWLDVRLHIEGKVAVYETAAEEDESAPTAR